MSELSCYLYQHIFKGVSSFHLVRQEYFDELFQGVCCVLKTEIKTSDSLCNICTTDNTLI